LLAEEDQLKTFGGLVLLGVFVSERLRADKSADNFALKPPSSSAW
jgi:hypothetical protein